MTFEQLLALIPEGKEFNLLRFTLSRIAQDFPNTLSQFTEARVTGWIEELQSGQGRTAEQMRSDIFRYIVTEEAIMEKYGVDQSQAQKLISGELTFNALTAGSSGDLGGPGGVLAGGHTIRIKNADGQVRYYQVYQFPPGSGKFVSYQFNDEAQAIKILGQDFDFLTRTEQWFKDNVLAEASIEEVSGKPGNWTTLVDEIMRNAAAAAGMHDPSLAGAIANDPEMQEIMAQAIIGGWSAEQILAQQRNSDFWKNVLYPGIENFYGRTSDPERMWVQYKLEAEPALKMLGYDADADGTFNSTVKRMLDLNIDVETFLQQVPVFVQAVQNVEFAGILNEWAEQDLGRDIDFNDWFDLMAGESAPELDAVAEKAQLAFQAQSMGAQVDAGSIEELAARTQMSAAEMARSFSEFTQGIIATGPEALSRLGMTEIDVLRGAAGLSSGDLSADQIRLNVAKLAREMDLFDEEKINFYVGFGVEGTPQRPGLTGLAPEGA